MFLKQEGAELHESGEQEGWEGDCDKTMHDPLGTPETPISHVVLACGSKTEPDVLRSMILGRPFGHAKTLDPRLGYGAFSPSYKTPEYI